MQHPRKPYLSSLSCSPSLSHLEKLWIMKHLLKSPVAESNLWKCFPRSFVSEAVVRLIDGPERNSTLGQRWQEHENQILLAGIQKQELELQKAGNWVTEQNRKERWEEIESFCHSKGIYRSAEQCRQRWHRLLHAFFKIKSWESSIPPGKTSFWSMKASQRKAEGLPFSLELETFHSINVIQERKNLWHNTAGYSSAGGVSTESPSVNANCQQQGTEEYQIQQCTEGQFHPETDESQSQHCTEETSVLIGSEQNMHLSTVKSSSALIEYTRPNKKLHDDDRPAVLVNFINQCLVDLEGLEYDSCDPREAQANTEKGMISDHNGPTEDLSVNADAKPRESIEYKIHAEGQRVERTKL